MANSRLIVVLGMHRSGTSVITRALQVMNVELGNKLMPAVDGDNPKGFFEDSDIYALNVEMLHALDIDWFSLAPVDDHGVETLRKKGFFLRSVDLLKSKCALAPVFAFKDPRIAKLLHFWKAVFEHCHFDVSDVVAVRHPRSVAESLSKRNNFDLEKGYLLWLEHVINIIQFTQNNRCVYVDYDNLIQAPDTQLRRVATALRLKINAAELKSFKSEFLDRSLRHTVFTLDDLEIDPACPPLVREIFGSLIGRADGSIAKSGRLSEPKLLQWVAEFSRLKSTLLYVDRLALESSNAALKLFVPPKVFQVFFDIGAGFSELDSVRIDTPGTGVPTEFVVDLPGSNSLLDLRVDPFDDFVVLRRCEISLINKNDEVLDLMPLSRPDAAVSAEGVYFFHTQDPAIYFNIPVEMLNGAKRLKITLAYVATGISAEKKYAEYCHATREREMQERLNESQDQMRGLSERAETTEGQLAQENALLVTRHEQAGNEMREAHAMRERELQQSILASQDQMQQLERGWNERAGATARQLAQEKALLVTQHVQAGNELRQAHAIRERELQERLLASQDQMQQMERGLNERARATESQLAQEKALLVTQYAQAANELREAHAARERELQERLLASQDQMQQLERGLSEKAGATERQLALEKALLAAQHAQAGNELRDAYATREQQLHERLLVAQDQLQKMERDWNARFQAKELLQTQQIALLNNQIYALQEKLYERLLEGQEQVQKLERDWAHKLVEQGHRQSQEREFAKNQLQAAQEKLQSGEREKSVAAALQLQAEKERAQAHAARESELHERLLTGQQQLLSLERHWIDKTEGQELLQAQDRALMNQQLQTLQEKIQGNELEKRQLSEMHLQSENRAAELAIAQTQAIDARRKLIEQINQSVLEKNLKLEKIRNTWFWRLFGSLNAATRNFNSESFASSLDGIEYVGEIDAPKVIAKSVESALSPARNLNDLLNHDGANFIECTYLTLLGRSPDQEGFMYYTNRLKMSGNKLELIYQVYSGPEARNAGRKIVGLAAAMRREKIKRSFKFLNLKNRKKNISDNELAPRYSQENEERVIPVEPVADAQGYSGYSQVLPSRVVMPKAGAQQFKASSLHTDDQNHPDTIDWQASPEEEKTKMQFATLDVGLKNISSYFMQRVEHDLLQSDEYTFTRLMHYIWNSRLDLQNAFNIQLSQGRIEYAKWFLCNASEEYGLTPDVYPVDLLEKLISLGGNVEIEALEMKDKQRTINSYSKVGANSSVSSMHTKGANLIGYAFGEFGMGEHVRMVARSLQTTAMPYCVLDQGGGAHGAGDLTIKDWVVDSPKFDINVFHVNADVFPPLCFKFREVMFPNRYNIGYWAWELSKCPQEFDVALNIVDEVWAISDFVADSFKTRAITDVVTMPLAVTVPSLDSSYTKKYYNLPEDSFIFLYTFDAASYLDRKNPIATIRAFKLAFPVGGIGVHLVLKTMNIDVAGPMWEDITAEAQNDSRIIIITKRMGRNDVLGMNLACDAFISLHRSEGFGRCVAEAMAYGKPVIVTNYSGTCDFANERTACLVDFKLVPVPKDKYPFAHGQVWAEPDIKHAARLMVLLATDAAYRNKIARAGQRYILDNFNETVIGARYATRLEKITTSRLAKQLSLPMGAVDVTADIFAGCIDAPMVNAEFELGDSLSIEGWAISDSSIAKVDVYLNSEYIGEAHYGVIRNDISRAHPNAPNAARSGYCYLLDTASLGNGIHELKVIATSQLGNVSQWAKTFSLLPSTRYEKWLAANEMSRIHKGGRTARKQSNFFSLVVRTDATTEETQLAQTFASIKAQGSAQVEVILMATDTQTDSFLQVFKLSGLTCKLIVVDRALQSATSVVTKCNGDLFGAIDAGSLLRVNTLAVADGIFSKNRRVDFTYGDEDHILDGIRSQPIFKPGWSPVFLESFNYIGSAWFARMNLIGRVSSEHNCSMRKEDEHALVTRVSQLSREVVHVPSVFLSRCLQEKTASLKPKSRANANQGPSEGECPKVSIVIPTCLKDIALIEQCFLGLTELTDYSELEIIVVFNNVVNPALIALCMNKWPFTFFTWDKPFSWSAINNFGASKASGECLLFMNDDVESIQKDWLKVLVQRLRVTGAGAVGPLLVYPNGTVQHAGIYVSPLDENVRHFFRFSSNDRANEHWLMRYPREVSAVTGACLLTTKACFDSVGGFDENLPLVCNDTDYCFRLGMMGYAVIIEPEAKLVHHEGVSRAGMPEDDDVAKFKLKWKKLLKLGDPFSNPNIDTSRDDWSIDSDMKQESAYRIFKSRLIGAAK